MSDGITDLYRASSKCNSRPTWDSIWMDFAKSISRRSHDNKHKVGAVIVTLDNTQVLAIGYNGDEKGGANLRESYESGGSGFIHAEVNALLKCDYNFPSDKKMYVTLSPCKMCAKAIVNSDIKRVIYLEEYNKEGIELLKRSGIIVKKQKGETQ